LRSRLTFAVLHLAGDGIDVNEVARSVFSYLDVVVGAQWMRDVVGPELEAQPGAVFDHECEFRTGAGGPKIYSAAFRGPACDQLVWPLEEAPTLRISEGSHPIVGGFGQGHASILRGHLTGRSIQACNLVQIPRRVGDE
jgi:hypothetical protein